MPDSAEQNPSDPRRRGRRHRYQEGPGFLFLATQNGRPRAEHQRPSLDRIRRRMRAVRLAAERGVEAACQELQVSRRVLYYWIARFQTKGIEGLEPRDPVVKHPTTNLKLLAGC